MTSPAPFFILQVVKLHTKLGKPIPSTDPVVATPASKPATKPAPGKSLVVPSATASKRVLATPKINFVGMFFSLIL